MKILASLTILWAQECKACSSNTLLDQQYFYLFRKRNQQKLIINYFYLNTHYQIWSIPFVLWASILRYSSELKDTSDTQNQHLNYVYFLVNVFRFRTGKGHGFQSHPSNRPVDFFNRVWDSCECTHIRVLVKKIYIF